MFEAPKVENVPYEGFTIQWGAAFTQQFQMLEHENQAAPNVVSGVNLNSLINIGSGFNNADANLYRDDRRADRHDASARGGRLRQRSTS